MTLGDAFVEAVFIALLITGTVTGGRAPAINVVVIEAVFTGMPLTAVPVTIVITIVIAVFMSFRSGARRGRSRDGSACGRRHGRRGTARKTAGVIICRSQLARIDRVSCLNGQSAVCVRGTEGMLIVISLAAGEVENDEEESKDKVTHERDTADKRKASVGGLSDRGSNLLTL